jgi:hypothetical protein
MIVALPRMMSPPHRTVALALGQATKWAGQHREHVTAVALPWPGPDGAASELGSSSTSGVSLIPMLQPTDKAPARI